MQRAGKCLCGAVTYEAKVHADASACHCGMCLRWCGGPFIGVGTDSIEWTGQDAITTFTSSKWAERGFCSQCGTNLFYRVTAEGKYQGFTSLAFGTLEDKAGLELTREWFFDNKPQLYTLEGERQRVTEAEAFAMLGDT